MVTVLIVWSVDFTVKGLNVPASSAVLFLIKFSFSFSFLLPAFCRQDDVERLSVVDLSDYGLLILSRQQLSLQFDNCPEAML
jgi:hypothetical protein